MWLWWVQNCCNKTKLWFKILTVRVLSWGDDTNLGSESWSLLSRSALKAVTCSQAAQESENTGKVVFKSNGHMIWYLWHLLFFNSSNRFYSLKMTNFHLLFCGEKFSFKFVFWIYGILTFKKAEFQTISDIFYAKNITTPMVKTSKRNNCEKRM